MMKSLRRKPFFKVLIAITALISTAYLAALLDQMTSKGWRDADARIIAIQIAKHISNQDKNLTVNTAQQYSDGCSFILFEIYTHKCFSIRISAPASSSLMAYDINQLAKIVSSVSLESSRNNRRINYFIHRPMKITFILESFDTKTEHDGIKVFSRSEIKRLTVEAK